MERDMEDEVAFHIEMETAKHVRRGEAPAEARRLAERSFGGVGRQKEAAREAWGISLINDLIFDLRRGSRQLRRSPGFALAAIVTLALGIGATTAIFSFAWRVLGDHPPVDDPSSLVAMYTTCRRGQSQCSSSWPDFVDYRERTRTLAGVEAFSPIPLNLGTDQGARLTTGEVVSGNLFSLLGVRAHLGRLIGPGENRRGSAASVVVVSHELWRTLFGADSSIIGRTVRLNSMPFTVIGVAGPGFRGMSLASPADAWIPVFAAAVLGESVGAVGSGGQVFDSRGNRWLGTIIGRRRPGVSVVQVRQEMDAMAVALGEAYPAERAAVGGVRGITVDPADGYILPLGSEAALQGFLNLLLAVVGVTLLLASVNVANLQLARASARSRELGVQLAIGAKRARLVRQLLTESVLLGVLGGVAGLAVAAIVLRLLGAYSFPGGISIGALDTGFDTRVLAFSLGMSLLATIGFGLLPALQATRSDLVTFMKGHSSRVSDSQGIRRGLITVQVALSVVLLVGSGLFLQTLRNSLSEPLGFEPSGAIAARFNLTLLRYGPEETATFTREVTRRVRELHGVRSAGMGTLVPFQGGGFRGIFVEIPGYEPAPDEEIRFDWVVASPGYFEALGMRLSEGRSFGSEDAPGTRPVAIVNRLAADRYWPGASPVGQTIRFFDTTTTTVIGVIEDPTWRAVGEDATPFVFISMDQYPSAAASGFLTLVARIDGPVAPFLPSVRATVRDVEPGLSLALLEPLDNMVGNALMPQRLGGLLLTLFSSLALILAAVGIYGVVGYTVTRQAREIGIRMAMGARGRDIILSVVRGITVPIVLGLGSGLAAALLLGGTVAAFMYGVAPRDPLTFGLTLALFSTVAVIAMVLPARRALRLDPITVLSSE
jgi:predicted permease